MNVLDTPENLPDDRKMPDDIHMRHKDTLELLGIVFVDTSNTTNCLQRKIEDCKDSQKIRYSIPNKALSPFKSPITSRVINLRSNDIHRQSKDSSDVSIIDQTKSFLEVFQDSGTMDFKQKRKSSIIAENRIKKIIENESKLVDESDLFVKSAFESMFCGLSKSKKSNIPEDAKSFIADILRNGCEESIENTRVLQDKTNSPRKNEIENKKSETNLNTKFFLDDSLIAEVVTSSTEKEEHLDYGYSRAYLKLKEANTKFNEGYKIVEIKKKVVIDLFMCPKSFYRKSERPRKVYFDMDGKCSKHNISNNLEPIIIETNEENEFKWGGEKEVVEVVKRIDLGSEASIDDFVFSRVDKSIQS